MERACITGRRAQLPNAAGVYASQRIMWHAFQGRLAEITPELDAFVDTHPGGTRWRPMRALARLAGGDVVAARAEFQDLLAAGVSPCARGVVGRRDRPGLPALFGAPRGREDPPMPYASASRRPPAFAAHP